MDHSVAAGVLVDGGAAAAAAAGAGAGVYKYFDSKAALLSLKLPSPIVVLIELKNLL